MGRAFVAWVTVDVGEPSPRSILVRKDGRTEPSDFWVPHGARTKVVMLTPRTDLAVEIADNQIVVRDRRLQRENLTMSKILRSFVAIDSQGLPYIIHIRADAAGGEELHTAGGLEVERLEMGKYRLRFGSIRLSSDDPKAP